MTKRNKPFNPFAKDAATHSRTPTRSTNHLPIHSKPEQNPAKKTDYKADGIKKDTKNTPTELVFSDDIFGKMRDIINKYLEGDYKKKIFISAIENNLKKIEDRGRLLEFCQDIRHSLDEHNSINQHTGNDQLSKYDVCNGCLQKMDSWDEGDWRYKLPEIDVKTNGYITTPEGRYGPSKSFNSEWSFDGKTIRIRIKDISTTRRKPWKNSDLIAWHEGSFGSFGFRFHCYKPDKYMDSNSETNTEHAIKNNQIDVRIIDFNYQRKITKEGYISVAWMQHSGNDIVYQLSLIL